MNVELVPTHRPDLSKDGTDFESLWIEANNKNGKDYLFCCAYRHPNLQIDNLNECLQQVLSNPAILNKQVFILGDFNIGLLNSDTHTANFFQFPILKAISSLHHSSIPCI